MHGTILVMKLIRGGIIDADDRKLQSKESEGSTPITEWGSNVLEHLSTLLLRSCHFKVAIKKDNEAYPHINGSMKKLATRAICAGHLASS